MWGQKPQGGAGHVHGSHERCWSHLEAHSLTDGVERSLGMDRGVCRGSQRGAGSLGRKPLQWSR